MRYFNQRKATIHRDLVKKNSGRLFLCIYQDNLINAMKDLGGSAIQAYLCLAFNKDGYKIDISPAYISKNCGICLDTARKALKELESKGYIIKDDNGNYAFYERKIDQKRLFIEKREFTDVETGEIYELSYSELMNIVGETEAKGMWEAAKK